MSHLSPHALSGAPARFAGWLNPERILVNVATVYRAPGELSPRARARLLLQMWTLGAELASAGP